MTEKPRVVELRPPPTSENVRELLDFAQREMEEGKVAGIALVTVYRDDTSRSQWAMEDGAHPLVVLGEIEMLRRDFAERVAERRGPPEHDE